MSATSRSRPTGATVLAVLLAVLSFAAFQNAFVWRSLGDLGGGQLPREMVAFVEAAKQPTFTALALAYSATAFVAAVGVWFVRSWMVAAFAVWAVVLLAFLLWIWRYFPIDAFPIVGGRVYFGVMIVVALALVWFCWRYLRRVAAGRQVANAL
jgi:hypothetical protein